MKACLIIGIALSLSMIFLFLYDPLGSIVHSINEKGWVLFLDASQCGFCQKQIKYLGKHFETINKVHCDDGSNKHQCSKFKELPVWYNKTLGETKFGAKLDSRALRELI